MQLLNTNITHNITNITVSIVITQNSSCGLRSPSHKDSITFTYFKYIYIYKHNFFLKENFLQKKKFFLLHSIFKHPLSKLLLDER